MNIMKKFILAVISILIVVLGIVPSFSYAEELNDAQRKALVDTAVKLIDEGNQAGVLRYSQDHRIFGYKYSKVTDPNARQSTVGNVILTNADLVILHGVIAKDIRKPESEVRMPTIRTYECRLLGDNIHDTMAFDCSSFVAAIYRFTVGTEYDYPWRSSEYSKDSKFFKKISLSEIKPGDVLWTEGHVAIYLGDVRNNGTEYIAEASGFSGINTKRSDEMRNRLMTFLVNNPKYIKGHPEYNQKRPTLELPSLAIVDARNQVAIHTYKPSNFTSAARYIGEIKKGDAIDVTQLTTTNPGDGSGADSGSSDISGLQHNPIVFREDYSVVWPKDMVLEDQLLVTSEGYFYKGTPTYGQYIGRVSLYNWFIEGTENVLDWIIGFVTYAFKAVLIGWTAIMENVISNILNFGITAETSQTAALSETAVLTKVPIGVLAAYKEEEAISKSDLTPVATLADNGSASSSTTQNNNSTVTQKSDIDA